MVNHPPTRARKPSEDGFILLAVLILLALFVIAMAVAMPKIAADIQRDRDVETMRRGKQYARAIQLYYRKFHAYPPNVDALIKTNDIRFLRKKYIDPTTGKDEWKPILFGQNKTPQAMGFFGQPLAAASLAGIGPAGGNTGLGGANPAADGGSFNSAPTSPTDSGTSTTGSTDANGNPTPGTGAGSGTTATGSGSSGSAFGSSTNPTGSGQTFGGGGIIGFSPQSPKQSLFVFKKKNHYNEWEFLYSPLMDQQNAAGGNTGMIGQPAGATTTPVGDTPTPTTPPTPTAPTSPTTPQQ